MTLRVAMRETARRMPCCSGAASAAASRESTPSLLEDRGDVVLRPIQRDAQRLADLVVGPALGDEVEHTPLRLGQVLDPGTRAAAAHRGHIMAVRVWVVLPDVVDD